MQVLNGAAARRQCGVNITATMHGVAIFRKCNPPLGPIRVFFIYKAGRRMPSGNPNGSGRRRGTSLIWQ